MPRRYKRGQSDSQLIHDIAPEAKLKFHTAFLGQFDFANGIRELANAGCDVIVDDVGKIVFIISLMEVICHDDSD